MVEAVYAAGHALLGAARLGVSQLPTLSHFAIFFTRTTRKRGAPERTGPRKRRAPESAGPQKAQPQKPVLNLATALSGGHR